MYNPELMFYISCKEISVFNPTIKTVFFAHSNLHQAVNFLINSQDDTLKLGISFVDSENYQLINNSTLNNLHFLTLFEAKKLLTHFIDNKFLFLFYKKHTHNKEFINNIVQESASIDPIYSDHKVNEWQESLQNNIKENTLSNFTQTYAHGRCHLFAIVAAELFGKNISAYYDLSAESEEGGYIDEECLVHAFVKIDDYQLFDVNGLSYIDDTLSSYPCNEGIFKEHSLEDFYKIIKQKKWGNFKSGEKSKIKIYIKDNLDTDFI